MTYTGDVLLQQNFDGDIDVTFENGQPIMTDGFESCVILAVFGENCVQNGMTKVQPEKFVSTFPSVIKRATVSDGTREDGCKALEKALQFLVDIKAAKSITVTGVILSAYAIGWAIDIDASNGGKYEINWEKGALTAGYRRIS